MLDLTQRTEWLVRHESVTEHEDELSAALHAWASERFPQARIVPYRCGFLLQPQPELTAPCVALVGHIDTVPHASVQRLGCIDGRVYGCGSSDMKAGVAVMMHALEQHQPGDRPLVGLFYDREEGPYADNGLEPLLAALPPTDFAVVFEPTCNAIQAGCVGSLQARVHFSGKRAHSARPWQGDNAIYKAAPLLTRLAALERRRVEHGGLEFFETVCAVGAVADGPTNAVPEQFSLRLNSRFAPGTEVEQAVNDLRALVGDLGELEILDSAPAGRVDLSHPALQRWIAEQQLPVQPKQAWTDVARLSQHGIPSFNFGPGDPAQAHQADEFCDIAAIHENYRLLRALIG